MKRSFACLIICALALSACGRLWTYNTPANNAPSKSSKALRVVAYNVGVFSKYTGDSTRDIAEMMKELGADAVAVCEQDSCNRRHAAFQTKEFAEALGAGWDYGYGSAMKWNGGSYGTGVVTDGLILDSFNVTLPKGDGYEPRVCVVAETADYVIAAVHLDHSRDEVRIEQARLINEALLQRYGTSRKPVFLCGDMNATPDSPTLSHFLNDWTILSETAPTYPSENSKKCIDYILALNNRARLEVLKTAVCTEFEASDVRTASDHLPVFVDVRIK